MVHPVSCLDPYGSSLLSRVFNIMILTVLVGAVLCIIVLIIMLDTSRTSTQNTHTSTVKLRTQTPREPKCVHQLMMMMILWIQD